MEHIRNRYVREVPFTGTRDHPCTSSDSQKNKDRGFFRGDAYSLLHDGGCHEVLFHAGGGTHYNLFVKIFTFRLCNVLKKFRDFFGNNFKVFLSFFTRGFSGVAYSGIACHTSPLAFGPRPAFTNGRKFEFPGSAISSLA